jgi:chromosome segregation and condensation protein ScpB
MAKKAAVAEKQKSGESKPKHPSGLSDSKVRVLGLLAKTPRGLTRAQLAEKTGIQKGWAKLLGAPSKGKPVKGTLEGDGYVESREPQEDEGRSMVYNITHKGKQALNAK